MKLQPPLFLIGAIALCAAVPVASGNGPARGTVITEHFTSAVLKENLIGIDARRSISIYLPPGYAESAQSYPVIYYFHNIGWSNEQMFAQGNSVTPVLDRAIGDKVIREFILVAPNYGTESLGCWYQNTPSSGRWLDFTIQEVIPFIERNYRAIRKRESRGLTGDYMGGYGALKFAMLYPEVFGTVYALHPVGTGSGLMPMIGMADWRKIHAATSFAELWGDHYAPGFVAMAQAYLPNPKRPPFFCDFAVELEDGEPKLVPKNIEKLMSQFHLDELLREHADGLRRMRAIAFDWGRYDRTQSHVYSNQAFSRKLDNLGIEHTGEEYNGGPWEKNWTDQGRVYARMLPFFAQNLDFGPHE